MADATLTERLRAAAEERAGYAADLLERLVAEPSLEGTAAIDACFAHVAAEVEGLAAELLQPANDGLASLIARFGRPSGERALAFSGHVDVVPAEGRWTTPTFELTRAGDLLRGRGVCDMKGGVAGFVAAIRALDDAGALDDCSLELVLTGDEEVGSRRGLIPLLERGMVTATAAICGEPTGLHVFLGNRGLIWSEVAIRGRGGHAGLVHTLANPIEPAVALAGELARIPLEASDERFDPPTPSLTVTGIETGDPAINVVPDEVRLTLDRRLVPGEEVEPAKRAVDDAVSRAVDERFETEVLVRREWPPYAIDADEPVARAAVDAARFAGREGRLGMDLASNDSSWLDQAGIPTVLLGPGEPDQAHVTDETLHADQLRDAILIYAHAALAMGAAREAGEGGDG
jgi:acetylornithine deacetylase/succinyl-diaminopimelate desuccinylase-like protein